jgi:hypothetical protein
MRLPPDLQHKREIVDLLSKTQPGFFGLHVDKTHETHVELFSGEAVGMGVVEISARPVGNFEEVSVLARLYREDGMGIVAPIRLKPAPTHDDPLPQQIPELYADLLPGENLNTGLMSPLTMNPLSVASSTVPDPSAGAAAGDRVSVARRDR